MAVEPILQHLGIRPSRQRGVWCARGEHDRCRSARCQCSCTYHACTCGKPPEGVSHDPSCAVHDTMTCRACRVITDAMEALR